MTILEIKSDISYRILLAIKCSRWHPNSGHSCVAFLTRSIQFHIPESIRPTCTAWSTLLAHEFKGDSQFAAAAVFYSTLAASLVVTVLLAILRAGWIPWAIP